MREPSALQQLQHGIGALGSTQGSQLDSCIEGNTMRALKLGNEILRGNHPAFIHKLHCRPPIQMPCVSLVQIAMTAYVRLDHMGGWLISGSTLPPHDEPEDRQRG